MSNTLMAKAISAARQRGIARIDCTVRAKAEITRAKGEKPKPRAVRVAMEAEANPKLQARFMRWGFTSVEPEGDPSVMTLQLQSDSEKLEEDFM